jgi:condensin complex subunit 2
VDSVHQSTYKVLGGLANNTDKGPSDQSKTTREGSGRRTRRGVQTLESDVGNLNCVGLEEQLDVDPLFHKMRADFDEGGAHGLLLNHLTTDEFGTLVFDSSQKTAAPTPSAMEKTNTEKDAKKDAERKAAKAKVLDSLLAGFGAAWGTASPPLCPNLDKLKSLGKSESSDSLSAMRGPDADSGDEEGTPAKREKAGSPAKDAFYDNNGDGGFDDYGDGYADLSDEDENPGGDDNAMRDELKLMLSEAPNAGPGSPGVAIVTAEGNGAGNFMKLSSIRNW